jgi:methionyl-tRNA synthetase
LLEAVRRQIDRQAFHEALETIWVVVRAANVYVDRQAPWALRKTDPARMATVLYVLAETVRQVALLMQPVTPAAVAGLLDQLAVPADRRSFAHFGEALSAGTPLPAPQGVFPRFVEPAAEEGAA